MQGGAGSWADLVAVNPRNADRLLAIGDGGVRAGR